jgi:serine/threonine protein kinase
MLKEMRFEPGDTIDDRYELIAPMGGGGFALVWKAFHKQFDRHVAIKFLDTRLFGYADNYARFEREAKALNGLKHKNIVQIYGFGVWKEAPYMVMELIGGISLQALIKREQRLPYSRAGEILSQLCEGLSCAHANGLLHRDLKPSNVMVVAGPDHKDIVKIIDFGLAKFKPGYGVDAQKLTEDGVAIGTCTYMAPEQCMGQPLDERSDIYSAGCILYECLTGSPPFVGEEMLHVMFQHLHDAPPHLRPESDPAAPTAALDAIVLKCLAKSAEDRYSDVTAMQKDLQAAIHGLNPIVARNEPYKTMPPKRSHVLGYAVACLGLMIAVIGWFVVEPRLKPRQATSVELYKQMMAEIEPRDHSKQKTLAERVVRQHRHDQLLDARQLREAYRHLAVSEIGLKNWNAAAAANRMAREYSLQMSRDEPSRWMEIWNEARISSGRGDDLEAIRLLHSKILGDPSFGNNAKALAARELMWIYDRAGDKRAALKTAANALKMEFISTGLYNELSAYVASQEGQPGIKNP